MLKQFGDCTSIEYGVDEVARGCLFGRVYAGAVVWKVPPARSDGLAEVSDVNVPEVAAAWAEPELPKGVVIRDSKKMSRGQRERASVWIRETAYAVATSYKEAAYIDTHNILRSAHDAMADAVRDAAAIVVENRRLCPADEMPAQRLLVDGNSFRPTRGVAFPHTCVVKGDATYFSIACAAIVAKVEHDHYIRTLCAAHPLLQTQYDLLGNMGYGTPKHRAGIDAHGITSLHRKTFACCLGKDVRMPLLLLLNTPSTEEPSEEPSGA
jgi:ribonuclease HII